jgi:anti-sigma B factor antagonist
MGENSQLIIENLGGVAVVNFDTNNVLDALQIQRIGEELYQLVDEQNRRKLVLDFSKVQMLSSQAIGMLLSLRKKSQAISGQVLLCGIRADLYKVFKITQIDKLFKFFDNEKAALAEFGVHVAG